MSSEEERTRPWSAVLSRRSKERTSNALEEMMAPEFVDHGYFPAKSPAAKASSVFAENMAAFSDARYHRGPGSRSEKVMTRFRCGTHDQEISWGSADRQELKLKAIVINRVIGGKIAEEWSAGTYA